MPTRDDSLVFQVDLFSARGPLPRDMYDVMARQKDIQYSSRTRLVTDYFRERHRPNLLLKRVLDKLPDEQLSTTRNARRSAGSPICRISPSCI